MANEATTFILPKYTNFVDAFSKNLAGKLSEYTEINNHAIKLIKG